MLLQNLRAKIGARLEGDSEGGFTLIELLVVMLILGILAAIALPTFFNQKDKAGDAQAKETAHSAQVAIETYGTDHNGSYAGATAAKLKTIESTLPAAPDLGVTIPEGKTNEYTVSVTSSTGNVFSIKNTAGVMKFECTTGGQGGCPEGGDWGG